METDSNGIPRLKFQEQGWNVWNWNGRRIHYIEAGSSGPIVLLIHGYGASAYHYRYTIPALEAQGYHVFSMCLLGFGWSEKALVDYSNGKVWVEQISTFIQEVIGGQEPVVLAGNRWVLRFLIAAKVQSR